jgi:hypothetical protein
MPLTRIEDNPDSNAAALGLVERAGSLSQVAKARRRRAMAYQLRSGLDPSQFACPGRAQPSRAVRHHLANAALGAKADLRCVDLKLLVLGLPGESV